MKLRVRFGKTTLVADFAESSADPPTLLNLREFTALKFGLSEFSFSLNGRDALCCENNDTTLASLDIVSGDLIHVLSDESAAPPVVAPPREVAASRPSTSAAQQQSSSSSQPSSHDGNVKMAVSPTSQSAELSKDAEAKEETSAEEFMDIEDKDCIKDAEVNRYLHEPVLLRDSTDGIIPQSLRYFFQQNPPASANDALCLALHILMSEAGYNIEHENSEAVQHPYTLPAGWKKSRYYQLLYTHPMIPGMAVKLNLIPLGMLLMVQGVVHVASCEAMVKLSLKSADYIKSLSEDAASMYHDLARLSRVFKDSITQPLLVSVRNEMGIPLETSLTGLYHELKMAVLRCLDAVSLARMAATCSEFRQLAKDPYLWRRLYLKDFGRRYVSNDIDQDWYQLYQEKHVMRKRIQRERRQMVGILPSLPGHPLPPLPGGPIYPPGFIGGDYDRDPGFPGLPGMAGHVPHPVIPRPRFDPIGPSPDQRFRPGRGGGIWDRGRHGGRNNPGGFGFGPNFF